MTFSVSTPMETLPRTLAGVVDWLTELENDGKRRIADSGRLGINLVAAESTALRKAIEQIRDAAAPGIVGIYEDDPVGEALARAEADELTALAGEADDAAFLKRLGAGPSLTPGRFPASILGQVLSAVEALNERMSKLAADPRSRGIKPADLASASANLDALGEAANRKRRRDRALRNRGSTAIVVGDSSAGAGNTPDSLERQVRRAMMVVLGQTVPNDAKTFGAAVRRRFSGSTAAAIQLTPVASTGRVSEFAVLPPDQVILYNEANAVASEALSYLANLSADDCACEPVAFDQAKAGIVGPLDALIHEFGREDGPRHDRVVLHFMAIDDAITQLRETSLVNKPATSPDREELDVRYRLVVRAIGRVGSIYAHLRERETSITFVSARLLTLLSIIGDSTRSWVAAMDRAGVTHDERRFVELDGGSPLLERVATDRDVIEELDDLATFLGHIPVVAGKLA